MFNNNEIEDAVRIYIKIKFSGEAAHRLIQKCMKKLSKCFKREKRVINMKLLNHLILPTKSSYITNSKYKISLLSQLSVVYKFVCPGCKNSALCGKGQKNMPAKVIIRKNKEPFMNTC